MAEKEGEVIADRPVAVVKVGVTHPTCLDSNDDFTRTGVGDDYLLDLHWFPLR
jgi:hypothetical protein